MRTNTNNTKQNSIKKQNTVKKKIYYTNKVSPRKFVINDNETNLDYLDTEDNTKYRFNNFKNKKRLYEEDTYYMNRENLEKSRGYEIRNKSFNSKIKNLEKSDKSNSENESSDVTIVSLLSEDIKDISSDFFDL